MDYMHKGTKKEPHIKALLSIIPLISVKEALAVVTVWLY